MTILLGLLRLAIGLGGFGLATIAILALFGFAVSVFDLFNHFQYLLFFGLLGVTGLAIPLFWARRAGLPVLAYILIGLAASGATYLPEAASALLPRPAPAEDRRVITLMTHNLFGMNYEMERVEAVIEREDPDIVALQEYFGRQSAELHPLITARYPYSINCVGGQRANLGLYSKIPFSRSMDGACAEDAERGLRTARILGTFGLEDGSRFSVITTHLDWPVPIWRQDEQLADLGQFLGTVESPLILVGDFNSTPWSYALRNFTSDSGLVRHTHNLLTFPTRFLVRRRLIDTVPILPLDHVMTRGDGIAVHEVGVAAYTGSDHLPVIARFSIAPQ
ncbi:hypothetical protein EMQ25_05085 [Arsenicitalea aurantiaca]|uniref:Endonuclease/exonuclease/phosphatase domain-containing protein n=1 Tax=Arsenicitalea aurantiaca TaxID=1783274 RepID=A0A433XEK6_9HYPH|nr:endonuclease/exonuclease/phosphatase family protein [Arsenicitalea aurantiaca]RUT32531.1 hypothetical protein EMQ25_05085 [Arsenicitalea aurantiaca]